MKNIIVPVDFSEQSEMALKVAAKLASKNKAQLLVLHMLELSPSMLGSGEYVTQEHIVHLIKGNEKRFSDFLDKPYLKGVQLMPIIKHYKVLSEINDVAKKHQADLIVMGSHGTDGLKEIFIGSNTEKVVRNADVPVLVVKGEVSDFNVDCFVFACDFKDESLPALEKAREFAEMLGTKLKLVYINTPADAFLSQRDANDRISSFLHLAQMGLEVEIYNDYTVERGVLNYADDSNADLIGIPTHGRKGLSHFFMGSIGEDVANHSSIPVVTFSIP